MKYLIVLSICLSVSMCTGEKSELEAPQQSKKQMAKSIPSEKATADKKNEVSHEPKGQPVNQKEKERKKLITAEWEAYEDKLISHSAESLNPQDKRMLLHLLDAAQIVEELHMLQLHPRNLEWRDFVSHSGSDVEKKLFVRNQMPWCEDNPSKDCSTIPERPERRIGYSHWPKDWKLEEYETIGRQINRDELLSPFTIVRRNAQGHLAAIPYAKSNTLGLKMRKLAAILKQAAHEASDKTLKQFLNSRAEAFLSDKTFPYDGSDYDWIALKGPWEVTVGPYEVYKNPHQTKALFEMIIGREDEALSKELSAFKSNLQEMENALSDLVGKEIYKGRQLDPRIAIRAIDVWMATGDGRKSRGATVAYHLPNRGKAVDEGLYKKVLLVNHSKAFESVKKRRAALVLSQENVNKLTFRDDITNVTFHELSHGFGAYHEMKVTNAAGKTGTVKQFLMELESLFEEIKADVFGTWLSYYLNKNGKINGATLERRYASAVIHSLGLFQYPIAETYPQMAAIELGWYLDAGALTWDKEKGKLDIVYEKMSNAVVSLAKHVATIQLTGDYAAAKALYEKYLQKDASDKVKLKGVLHEVRETILKKFKNAGIKSPSLRYRVTGLE